MAKNKSRPHVRRELSDEAKLARLRQWEKQYKLNSDDINKLIEKYGPYAYDVVRLARAEPANVAKRINQPFRNSNNTIHYFAETEIDTATLAKAINKNEMKVEAGLAQYNVDAKQIKENAEIKIAQDEANKRQKKFEEKVDAHAAAKEEPVKDNQQETHAADEQDLQQITDREPGDMSLTDWVKNYPADKKPLTKTQLLEAAYNDFGKSEGKIGYVYQDHLGNPTIGNGHLIFRKSKINNASHIAMYRKKFQALSLVKNGKELTADEKGKLYDAMVKKVRETGKIGAAAQYGTLSQSGMKKIFKEDCGWAYDVAKKQFPQIDSYPSDLQLTLVHAYFGGYANIIDNAIKGKTADLPKKYRTEAMRKFVNIDKNDPQAVQNLLETMISDINGRNTANAYEKQIKAVSDTLSTTQQQYAKMQQQLEQQQRQQNLNNNIRVAMSMGHENTPS